MGQERLCSGHVSARVWGTARSWREAARGPEEGRGEGATSQPECPGGTPFLTFPQISTVHDSLKCHEVYLKTSAWKSQPDLTLLSLVRQTAARRVHCAKNTRKLLESVHRGGTRPRPRQVLPGQIRPKWGITQFRKMKYAFHPTLSFSLYVCRMYSPCLRCHVPLSKFKSSFLTFLTVKKLPHHSIYPPSLKYIYI